MERKTLDKNNAFNIMINLFLIRYLYTHMEKNDKFQVEGAKRRTSTAFYKKIIPHTKTRFYNTLKGEGFTFSPDNVDEVASKFNISKEYFQKNGKFIKVKEVEEEDWKIYFNEYHHSTFDIHKSSQDRSEIIKKIQTKLSELIKEGFIEDSYDTNSPLYRINYYYKNMATFTEDTNLNKFLKSLVNLKISDWEEIEQKLGDMEKYRTILYQHFTYVDSFIKCKKLKDSIK